MVFKKQKYSKKCFYLKCTYCLSKYLKQINWLRILIQLKFFFYKLPFEEFSGVTVKDKKIAQKWKTMELIQISLHFVHKITIITNFLAFFRFFLFFPQIFPSWIRILWEYADPDPRPWFKDCLLCAGMPDGDVVCDGDSTRPAGGSGQHQATHRQGSFFVLPLSFCI